jgi:cellobiose-specific phosphotransferase system component IIC
MHKESEIRDPLILGNKTYHDITRDIARPVEGKANKYWWILFILSVILFLWGVGCMAYTVGTGIGVWGLNKTVNWAWDITNFVWWIGIGHAGTLISAVVSSKMENGNKSFCRSNDNFWSNTSRFISCYTHG